MRYLHLFAAVAAFGSAAPAAAGDPPRWGGAWGYATSPATKAVKGELPAGTYRFRLRLSQSGDGLRLTFTNPEGAVPLRIARATVAAAADTQQFGVAEAERPIAFTGSASTTITGGAVVASDPVDFAAISGADVIVTVTTDAPTTTVGGNAAFPLGFSVVAPTADGASFTAQKLRPFVTLVAVRNPPTTCTIVAFGDSITEGARGTRVGWRGWPGALAEHLVAASPRRHCGVVNMGISGNRLLRDGRGTAGIDRFDRDVASVPGVSDVIVLEGVNDIWHSAQPNEPGVSAEDLIAGYRTLIAKAHARGMRIYGATLTPGAGSKYLTPQLESLRQQVNRWIRTSHAFDAVIDLERVVRDGNTPPQMRPSYDSGDHLHPGDAGYAAMGKAISLGLFSPRP